MIIRKLQCLVLIALGIVGVSSSFGQEAPVSGGRGESGANFGRGGNGGRGRGPLGGAAVGFIQTPVYDKVQPELPADLKPGGILIYSKTNGFREEAGIQASDVALAVISKDRGWPYYVTENAAIMNKDQLARFKVVVWNNNSGDTLTPEQREAFKTWLENGGSYVGIHGAGGDPKYQPPITRSSLADWPWYIDSVVGAQFTSHSRSNPVTLMSRI